MAGLKFSEKNALERALGMRSGYVLNFTNRTFAEAFHDVAQIDIFDDKYATGGTSKANRLRAFWASEPSQLVAKVVEHLLDHASSMRGADQELITSCRAACKRLALIDDAPSNSGTADVWTDGGDALSTIPRFRHVRELGGGLHGKTFLFEDEQLRRRVAIKFLAADAPGSISLLEQVRALAQVEHANVVRVYEYQRLPHPDGGHASDAVVMEFVDGPPLGELIRSGAIGVEDALQLGEDLISGLRAIHKNNLVHSDLHPGNVLVVAGRTAKIIDLFYRGTLRTLRTWSREHQLCQDLLDLGQLLGAIAAIAAPDPSAAFTFREMVRRPVPLDELASRFREALASPAPAVPGAHAGSSSGPDSVAHLVAAAKECLVDPRHRIRLADLVREETEAAFQALHGPSFDMGDRDTSGAAIAARLSQYETVMERLSALLAVGATYGIDDHDQLWLQVIRRMLQELQTGGFDVWLQLQRYPALIVQYVVGIAASAHRRFNLASHIVVDPRYVVVARECSACLELHPAGVLGPDLQKTLPEYPRRKTPLSDHLLEYCRRSHLGSLIPAESDLEEAFDRFEFYRAMEYARADNPTHRWIPSGRFSWRNELDASLWLPNRIHAEIAREGHRWPPVQGGLCGGDVQAAIAAEQRITSFLLAVGHG